MQMKRTALLLLSLAIFAFAQKPTKIITDASIPAESNVTFYSDTVYVLDGGVFVDSAATLTIQAGTRIEAEDGRDTDASFLVVTRDAQIFAEGTADNPIVFTSVLDDGNLDYQDRGFWGGVILLGRAPTNNDDDKAIEGVNQIDPKRALYGGDDADHNSGVFKYVSIRHTGINIGSSGGNEIQGLTCGAIGSKTTIEYVESYASDDDGFEFFGGTVNTRFLVSAFCSDDAFDWDEGFNGKHQFWFAIQAADKAGRVAEMDGAGGNEQGMPYAKPVLANVTFLGAGLGATPSGDGEQLLMFRDNTGGYYYNSIFGDYDDASTSLGITVEDIDNSGEQVEDSRKRLEAGDLALKNNYWFNIGADPTEMVNISDQVFVATHLLDNANSITDPMLRGISRSTDAGLDPRPEFGSPALNAAMDLDDDHFIKVPYVGAFGGYNWLQKWTVLDEEGFLAPQVPGDVATKIITDASIPAEANVTFYADTTYILSGAVFVDSAATLTIQAGTIIKAEDGRDTEASALVVTRDAQIFAEGTRENPIIFTSVLDDLDGSLDYQDRGLWGGVILLGRAPTNNDDEKAIEGINQIDPKRALYGGDDADHDTGVFKYVSIRHTGINIGSSTGNEIQGLTCGAVGAGTTIEYVESFASDDDGFEFFGGTVNTRYLVSAFCSDDAFDWDEGFNGKHQFWFAIQADDKAGRVAEMDGAGGTEQGMPYAKPILANVTYLGAGLGATPSGDGEQLLMFRDNTGGYYYNSIFGDYDDASTSLGITVEDIDNSGEKVEDSRKRLEAGDLALENNYWFKIGADPTEIANITNQDFVQTHLLANANSITDPNLRGIGREQGGKLLDPRPASGSSALTAAMDLDDDYFFRVPYVGAFGGYNWLNDWTALDGLGYVADASTAPSEIIITDADIPAESDVTFFSDNIYILSGTVFVDSAATLTIEAGTVIKAEDGRDTDASALVVTRDAQIFAEGTADNPIVFTSILDDGSGSLDYQDRGLWGGVILLGRAPTNNDGDKAIEGINQIDPERALYGGTDSLDNSGVFKYVSIRHTGINIGSSTGNEIQGLTCGAVGAGTTIEFVESFASDDDGFEFFGGTVNTRYLVSAFCSDDAFDWDEGFRGYHQYWFAIQANDKAGRVAEMDGAGGNEQGMPYAMPVLSNVTYLGAGLGATPSGDGEQLLMFRDNTGGFYHNSIFGDYDDASTSLGITVEDIDNSGEKVEDSRKRLEAGDLALKNNYWFDIGANPTTLENITNQDFVATHLVDNSNTVANPQLRGIGREQGGKLLDPRLSVGSPAATAAVPVEHDFFDAAPYVGAFGVDGFWLYGWTALHELEYVVDPVTNVEDNELNPQRYALAQNFPNPFNPSTTIQYQVPVSGNVKLVVFNSLGQKIATLVNGRVDAGQHEVQWNAVNAASGTYFYQLISADGTVMTRKMVLIK
jgi:hypothetical protein